MSSCLWSAHADSSFNVYVTQLNVACLICRVFKAQPLINHVHMQLICISNLLHMQQVVAARSAATTKKSNKSSPVLCLCKAALDPPFKLEIEKFFFNIYYCCAYH